MKQQERVTVLRPFDYSENGVKSVRLSKGDEPLIDAALVDGLVKEKYVERPKSVPLQPAGGSQTGAGASQQSSPRGRLSLSSNAPQSAAAAAPSQSTPQD